MKFGNSKSQDTETKLNQFKTHSILANKQIRIVGGANPWLDDK